MSDDLPTRLRRVIDFATTMQGRMYCLSDEAIATLKEALAALEPVSVSTDWHQGDPSKPLVVPPPPKMCPAHVYGTLTVGVDGTETMTTYLKCEECGAEFQPDENGVFRYPVPCQKEAATSDYLVDIQNPDQEHRLWVPPGFSHAMVNGERIAVDPKGQFITIPKRVVPE